MKTIDYLEYQKIGTGKLAQKVENGSTASRDIMVDFWLKLLRWLIPTALFEDFGEPKSLSPIIKNYVVSAKQFVEP